MCHFIISIFVLLSLLIFSNAQNEPQDYVKLHNEARAKCGVGPMKWDEKVASYAQNYAQQRTDCALIHSQGPYGENIAYWSDESFTAKGAIDMWMSEDQYYDYKSNTCASGQECRHYTQIMWKNSTSLGCGRVKCNDGGTFITCNYDPPGNYVGEKPY